MPAPAPASPDRAAGIPASTFGTGQWQVGTQIAHGRYFSDPGDGCYWERQSGLSGMSTDVIANALVPINPGQLIVDIQSSDMAFKSNNCGTWGTTPRSGQQETITPGTWLVGSQVAPGQYRASVHAGCRWKRLRDFSGQPAGMIDGNDVSAAGEVVVTIHPGDSGFSADAWCGEWFRGTD